MVAMHADLPKLLAAGEQAVFHGSPAAAVEPLEAATGLAREGGLVAEAMAATWLCGVALVALGRYGTAMDLLSPLFDLGPDEPPEQRLFASLAGSTLAGLHRHLGRHEVARELDTGALAMGDPSTQAGSQACFDAVLGLAAGAIALGDPVEAQDRLGGAAGLLPADPTLWWRQRVRLDWVRTQAALLAAASPEARGEAIAHATGAVDGAEKAQAPSHVAESLLCLGIAQSHAERPESVPTLRRAVTLSHALGALPLVWAAASTLSGLLVADEPAAARGWQDLARAAADAIAEDLPEPIRGQWLARREVAALRDH